MKKKVFKHGGKTGEELIALKPAETVSFKSRNTNDISISGSKLSNSTWLLELLMKKMMMVMTPFT